MNGLEQVVTSHGTRIYRIPLTLFPGMHGFAHLITDGNDVSLFDVGSGFGKSNDDLESGLNHIAEHYAEDVSWDRISRIFISHGHIDHYGGLHYVRAQTAAPIVIHELERRVLTNYDDRLAQIAARLEAFLEQGGVPELERQDVMDLYLLHKGLFSSIEIQATYEQIGMKHGRLRFEHVPGHCPGQVIAWVDDILLSSDHILKETSPHQAPECLSLNMGLEHYLASLAQVYPRSDQARLTLGGHEGPIEGLRSRIDQIIEIHRQRLSEIMGLLEVPMTLHEVSRTLFPKTEGYHRLLALEEAGAHLEYLHLRGYIALTDTPGQGNKIQRYQRLGGGRAEFPGISMAEPFQESDPAYVGGV